MKRVPKHFVGPALALAALATSPLALAAGGDIGNVNKQATNWIAIIMFGVFVAATLWITKWAAGQAPNRPPTSIPPAAASPASKTVWRLRATTCRPPPSWGFPRW